MANENNMNPEKRPPTTHTRRVFIKAAMAGIGVVAAAHLFPNSTPEALAQEFKYDGGFGGLHDILGDEIMGRATSNPFADSKGTGDVQQTTEKGLAFWRNATNIPTYTNGNEHWAITATDQGDPTSKERGKGLAYWTGTSIDPPGLEPGALPTGPGTEVAGVGTTDAAEKTVTPFDLLRQQAPDVIGDLDRDNITIDNFGTTHRINTSNFVAISQAAKNHGKKLRVDFYDSLDKTPYKDAPKARGGYIPGHSMYSGETSDRRSVELTGQSLPTFYHFTEQLPDGTMKLTLALGDRFADLYTTPEQYHEAEQGIALQVAIVIEHGIVNDPTSLIGKPFSTDTRVVIGGGQAEQSAIKLFPAIVSDGNGLPISTDSSLTTS